MIMASHSGAFHMLVGGTMVCLFLVLGGFFAARPYQDAVSPDFSKPGNWFTFYIRRAARILPAFWLVSFVVFLTGTFKRKEQGFHVFFNNITMREANGHFWYVQTQCIIYLLEPLIFLMIGLIWNRLKTKYRNTVCGIIMIVSGVFLEHILPELSMFTIRGNNRDQYLRIGLFCIGIGYGFIARDLGGITLTSLPAKLAADFMELLLLLMGMFTAGYYLVKAGIFKKEIYVGWRYPVVCGLIAGILLLLLLINSEGLVSHLLSLPPIQAVGEASYCVFLVQSVIIRLLKLKDPERKWLIACIASAGIGYMSYHLFETPVSSTVDRFIIKMRRRKQEQES